MLVDDEISGRLLRALQSAERTLLSMRPDRVADSDDWRRRPSVRRIVLQLRRWASQVELSAHRRVPFFHPAPEPVVSIVVNRAVYVVADLLETDPLVYRLYDGSYRLLYVGMTVNPLAVRLAAHRKVQSWWKRVAYVSVEECASLRSALEAEALAIYTEGPVFNKAGLPRPPKPAVPPRTHTLEPWMWEESIRVFEEEEEELDGAYCDQEASEAPASAGNVSVQHRAE